MRVMRSVRVAGTGMFVPPRVVTNADLTKLMDTSDEWIQQRTGVVERHHVDAGMGPAELAHEAAKQAIANAGITPEQVDAIVVASLSPHHDFPGIACFLQDHLGIAGCPAMDVRCQCTGFLYALQVGELYVASGQYDRVLVVGAEVHSTGMDFTTRGRDVAVIFGDGAGAVVLEASPDPNRGILSVHTHAEGKYAKKLWVEAPGSSFWPQRITHEMLDEGRQFPRDGGPLRLQARRAAHARGDRRGARPEQVPDLGRRACSSSTRPTCASTSSSRKGSGSRRNAATTTSRSTGTAPRPRFRCSCTNAFRPDASARVT